MSLRFKSEHSDSAVHVVCSLSHVWLFATPWIVAGQAPLSMGFLRREYWYGLACPPPGDLSNPGIELVSPALAGIFFFLTTELSEKPFVVHTLLINLEFCLSMQLFRIWVETGVEEMVPPLYIILFDSQKLLGISLSFQRSRTLQLVSKCPSLDQLPSPSSPCLYPKLAAFPAKKLRLSGLGFWYVC